MTREIAKELLPIIQAFAEGKAIQYRIKDNKTAKWNDVDKNYHEFSPHSFQYRIKPGTQYRPFKDGEECWNEMKNHQPFGWLMIGDWYCTIEEIRPVCTFCHGGGDVFHYGDMVKQINFADGTPFGIKVEEENI